MSGPGLRCAILVPGRQVYPGCTAQALTAQGRAGDVFRAVKAAGMRGCGGALAATGKAYWKGGKIGTVALRRYIDWS